MKAIFKKRLSGKTLKIGQNFATSGVPVTVPPDLRVFSGEFRKVRHAGHNLPRRQDPLEVL